MLQSTLFGHACQVEIRNYRSLQYNNTSLEKSTLFATQRKENEEKTH